MTKQSFLDSLLRRGFKPVASPKGTILHQDILSKDSLRVALKSSKSLGILVSPSMERAKRFFEYIDAFLEVQLLLGEIKQDEIPKRDLKLKIRRKAQ